MKAQRLMMGMPIAVELVDPEATAEHLEAVFRYFQYVDDTFSTYKPMSEISLINAGQVHVQDASSDMRTIFQLAEETKRQTGGYFDIQRHGRYDPSGIVKGWAIQQAAELLHQAGLHNYYVDAGGDIAAVGHNAAGGPWRVGIRNPFNPQEIVKVIGLADRGVATSGTYIRGQHIYNPLGDSERIRDIVSLTVIGPNIYEADRFATAAFAMGRTGVQFIEALPGFEGYLIDAAGVATLTSGFEAFVTN